MIKKIIYMVFCMVWGYASNVEFHQINPSKNTIQIAVAKERKNFQEFQYLEQQYDTYIEKRLMYVLYVVNIEPSKTKKVLQQIRQRVKDAFVIPTSNIGQPLKQQPVKNKAYNQQLYKEALHFYKQKNFEKAYALFDELFFQSLDSVMINFYLGRSAYETGRYEFAISAYDRILIKEPNNVRVRLELAQTYLKMQLYAQALSEFNTALQGKMPLKVQQRVLSNIELIKQRQTKHFFNVTALFGLTYDSNINTAATAGDYTIYSPTLDSNLTLTDDGEKQSAMIAQTVGIINHTYKPNDNFAIENSLMAMVLKYNNHKSNDIHYVSLSSKPTWYAKSYKSAVEFRADKIYYGHEKYQLNYSITPSLTKVITPTMLYSLGLKVGQINNEQDSNKDANVIEWQNSLKYLSSNYGIFTFKANLGKEIEQKADRTDVSYSYYHFAINNSFDFWDNYALQSGYAYDIENYKDVDVNFLTKREDKKHEFTMGIQKKLNEKSVLKLGGSYVKRPSNHAIYDYDKYTIKLSYIKNF